MRKNNVQLALQISNKTLYKKQFGFQERHSTKHGIILLTDQINSSFDRCLD